MTIVAMWCRHQGDNLIGIGNAIPWCVESDAKHFLDVVQGQAVVCGRKTYESLPNRTIEGCEIYVMTSDANYEVEDAAHHHIINGQKVLADVETDLYVAGGAEIYRLFMEGKEKLKPHIVVDCVYDGQLRKIDGKRIDITDSIEIMEKKYRRVSPYYKADGVSSAIWVRKGEFVEQGVLKRIAMILEKGAETEW